MRWQGRRKSSNIEDRRSHSPRQAAMGGAGLLPLVIKFLPMLLRHKMGRYILLLGGGLLLASYMGIKIPFIGDPLSLSNDTQNTAYQPSAEEQSLADFTAVVLADTEETWHKLFREAGQNYPEPKLVLFSGSVNSACGSASSAMGPFYCPGDRKVYIDLSFYSDLKNRHNAPGDFAQAYVIAHEVGHHIQTVTGTSARVHQQKQKLSKTEANKLSVKQELQADCYAGVWAFHADKVRNLLEVGDIEEALNAATAIGDDRLQKQARGYITPESFTHGSSKQRVFWFKRGFQNGNVDLCDTFSANTNI